MKHRQGFRVIEALTVIVLLAILGFAGWYAWKQHTQPVAVTTTKPNYTANTPSDLQAAILATTKKDYPACIKDGQVVDVTGHAMATSSITAYTSGDVAFTGIGCNGGSIHLFAKVNDTWTDIASTNFMFGCAMLKKYHVPAKLYETANGDRCVNDANDGMETYTGP